jgi:hypothetical protein
MPLRTFLVTRKDGKPSFYEHTTDDCTDAEALKQVEDKHPDYERIINLTLRDRTLTQTLNIPELKV